jgi:hypothetical protein
LTPWDCSENILCEPSFNAIDKDKQSQSRTDIVGLVPYIMDEGSAPMWLSELFLKIELLLEPGFGSLYDLLGLLKAEKGIVDSKAIARESPQGP